MWLLELYFPRGWLYEAHSFSLTGCVKMLVSIAEPVNDKKC